MSRSHVSALLASRPSPALRLVLALGLVLIGSGPTAAAEFDSVTLKLVDGPTLTGRVTDLGGPDLEVAHRLGSKKVAKRRVEKWIHNSVESSEQPRIVLIKRGGHEVTGDIEFDSVLGEWIVRLPQGEARYKMRDVRRVIQHTGLTSDDGFTPRANFSKLVQVSIEDVRSADKSRQAKGAKLLRRYGFFALDAIDAVLLETGANPDPEGRLAAIALEERVEIALPAELIAAIPGIADELFRATAERRLELLRNAFFDHGPDVFPLLGVLLLDSGQPAEVRGFAVDLLQRTHQLKDLVRAFEKATGRARVAVAVALGDAGLYIGVGALIEALELDPLSIQVQRGHRQETINLQVLAASKLLEYTGEDFAYKLDGDPDTNRLAIQHWREWWHRNEGRIETAALEFLEQGSMGPRRQRAAQIWREGIFRWEDGNIGLAEEFFRRAIAEDATCVPPFVCMGIIAYQHHGRVEEAGDWIRRALRRAPEDGDDEVLRLAYYHMGRISELNLDYDAAEGYYRRAIEFDEQYIDAWHDLGMAIYRGALSADKVSVEGRAALFRKAIGVFEAGLKTLETYRESLVFLGPSNLPIGSDLPFSTRDHNRGLKDVKNSLAGMEGEFRFQIAVICFALAERELARDWAEKAIAGAEPRADYHLLLARIFKELGRKAESVKQIAAARKIDPLHPRLPK